MRINFLINLLGGWYEGEWKNDELDGFGKFVSSDGDVYTGQFKDDRLHGK